MGTVYKKGCKECHYLKPYADMLNNNEMQMTPEHIKKQQDMRDFIEKSERDEKIGIVVSILLFIFFVFVIL